MLNLIGEVSGLLDVQEFCNGLLSALRAEIPCDYVSLNQVAPDSAQIWSISEPPVPVEMHAGFARHALQNPLAAWHLRTRDGRPIRFSDIVTREELQATDLYSEVYSQLGIEFQIAFTLPSPSGRVMAIALSRTQHDFTDTERELLTLARPHLIQAYRNALQLADHNDASRQPPIDGPNEQTLQTLGLTPAQARVLRRIALGASTPDIASELQIAQRTVHKHLQRIYEKLQVTDRSAAAKKAWEAVNATRQP